MDHIWIQLGLGYTLKQIYDKHKAIWWAKIDVGEVMTRDDFIRQQNIVYLDRKHKRRSWHLHKNPIIFLRTWAFNHLNDVFYFQDTNENNGIHVPFTILWCLMDITPKWRLHESLQAVKHAMI
jgi:hypothetical protein